MSNKWPELEFPCEYPVKVFGLDEDDFTEFIINIIARHVPGLPKEAFITCQSSTGKYISISVTFIAESRSQVDGLYEELGATPRVLTAL